MKKIIALALSLVMMSLCCAALAESTYTCTFDLEALAGVTDMNGFVVAMPNSEINTITLNDDGTYVYTKLLGTLDENNEQAMIVGEDGSEMQGIYLVYVYTGEYTMDGDQVVLGLPVECEFSEDWGVLVAGGWMSNSEGKATEGARVHNYEGVDFDPWDNFSSQVYKFDGHDTPVSVTIHADGTFTYNAVANSDDD